jgi:hypothetical protein
MIVMSVAAHVADVDKLKTKLVASVAPVVADGIVSCVVTASFERSV